jgi:hypothetical protein
VRTSYIVALLCVLTSPLPAFGIAAADIPPPQKFVSEPGEAKSRAVLVVVSDSYRQGPSGNSLPNGSEYITNEYCQAVVDIDAARGAFGTLTIKGRAVPYTADKVNAPDIDEIDPVNVDARSSRLERSIVVPLRHDVTDFYWSPDPHSSGAMYAWATAIRCGFSIAI